MIDVDINIETNVRSMTKLLSDLKMGLIQIPPFQRQFVWHNDDVKSLLDSIKKNYPIGSVLLWRPLEKPDWNGDLREIGSFTLPQTTNNQIYVLDGYQRLSTLFGTLTNPQKSGLKQNVNTYKDKFEIFYDLENEEFVFKRNRKPEPYQVPAYILMSTSDFRQYSRKIMEPNVLPEKLDLYLDRADSFSLALIEYKIAVIEVTNANLEEAVDIFSRINSKGTDISPDWAASALSYGKDFNLSIEMDNLILDLAKYNFDGISRSNLFRCYQSAFDDRMFIDQQNIERLAKRNDFSIVVKRATPAIKKAVRFLYKELNVVEYKLLPYNNQLVFIMKFFMEKTYPTEKELKELKEWFWFTSYSSYFTVYSLSGHRKAFQHFVKWLKGEVDKPKYVDQPDIKLATVALPEVINLSSVRSKSLVLFELKMLKELKNDAITEETGLLMGKIIPESPTSPSNIFSLFKGYKIDDSQDSDFSNWSLPTDLRKAMFIPSVPVHLTSKFLEERKKLIMKNERTFVESLDLIYTE